MSKLLDQLGSLEGKQAFQVYTVEHGIEKMDVLIPVKQTSLFEDGFKSLTQKDKPSILELVGRCAGRARTSGTGAK